MNGNKAQIVQLLIQGGAVSIALVAVFFMYKLTSNHFTHNTEVLIRVEESSKAQVTATMQLTEAIKDLNQIIR